jgi:hypothetical protein
MECGQKEKYYRMKEGLPRFTEQVLEHVLGKD